MRELKFRAWDTSKKKWLKEFCLMEDGDIGLFPGHKTSPLYIEIMQFTGLLDKNGREIFEGDIVRDTDGSGTIYKVYWDDGGARFSTEGISTGDIGLSISGFNDEMEVIGNIYENPELLNTKED